MKVKLIDGTELECSVEEFVIFQNKDEQKVGKKNIEKVYKTIDKIPTKIVIEQNLMQQTTKLLNYIKENPLTTIQELEKILSIPASKINKTLKNFGGLKTIRKSLHLPLRRVSKANFTEKRRKQMSFICNRGRQLMNTKGLTRKEAFKKAAAEWKTQHNW